ncbi:DUF3891 family protein [Christiangramia forsetii]|uniref:DUF3891 family protein n=2 Tax=Christiangramia forsetii TaxID=411153 RepID=A0M2P6_CHRFK|nr:DUF3891 family protein [Christiangramia forsetii]GGG44224.1 hypothetical protein GCM10011532_30320 [Christiangramia forsetii]CAL66891.1 conserved hypothetical protein [Christiangramia forsetii KT0803]
MIVNSKNEGWEIFSHSSHGLLAGKIAHELTDTYKNENWVATLAAIIEHDDRQLDFEEKNYLTEMGTPRDFLLEKRNTHEIIKRSKRLLSQANEKSCWIAMLIAHHLQFIYKEMRGENKTVSKFLKELEQTEKNYLQDLQITQQEVETIYQVMVFADRCSLILCQDEVPEKNREIEINTSIAGKTYWLSRKKSGNIQVRPWVFAKRKFHVTAEYKLLTQSSFSSNNEFQDKFENSPVKIKTWQFYE